MPTPSDSIGFDAYRKWLGIPPGEQPPSHYRLLAIAPFEQDLDVIETAADVRMSHLRTYQTGPHSALSQKLLNEVAAAKLCLLDRQKKSAYDAELRQRLDAAQRPMPALPVAMPVPAVAPTQLALAAPQIEHEFSFSPVVTSRDGGEAVPSSVLARSQRRLQPIHLAVVALGGLAVGLLLAWLFMSGTGGRASARLAENRSSHEADLRTEKASPRSAPVAMLPPNLAGMLKSIERPSPLGVVAEKLVIHNAHSGPNNDVGTLECNVQLLHGNRKGWKRLAVAVPWAPNEDHRATLALPPERFDRLRVEITKWEKGAGALAEIEVLSADGRNLALGCPTIASGAMNGRLESEHVTDSVTSAADQDFGAWMLPAQTAGWVEVDLSLPRPEDLAGVTADKLVIWNQHNASHNDRGALECNVRLLARRREVWSEEAIVVPWVPNADHSVTLPLPSKRFDKVRIEITKWQQRSGGLAEVQVLRGANNLSLNCPAIAAAVFDEWRSGIRVTDGIVNSDAEGVGYWHLWLPTPGWVEVDLACLDAKYGAACRKLGLALALLDGDWQRGLLWLARGDDPSLRKLAHADLQNVFDTPEQLALGDAWWELAQQAEGEVRKRLLARSLWRYRQALHKLREFRKTQIQARFDDALPELPERDYLYFMPESELKHGWGMLRETFPMSVKGVRSPYALFMHAIANDSPHAAFHLGKRYRRFRGAAAINDSAGAGFSGELTFRVAADGRELWKSQPLQSAGSSQSFDLDVGGVDKIELFVDCSRTDGTSAHSVWIEPRLER